MESDARPPGERRRNAVLESIELMRALYPPLWVSAILAFLYICENEGINIRELAYAMQTTDATASRSVRALLAASAEGALAPSLDLLISEESPLDGRGRLVFLSQRGKGLRDMIDGIIVEGVTTRALASRL